MKDLHGRLELAEVAVSALQRGRGGGAAAGTTSSLGLPSGVKVDRPAPFTGKSLDSAAVENFVFAADLFFQLSGVASESAKAGMVLLWLREDAQVWWRSLSASHPMSTLTWSTLRGLLLA